MPAEYRIDDNVYVLVAGFSRDRGYPLMKDFLPRMGEAREWLAARGRYEKESVRRLFEFRLNAAAAAYRCEIRVDDIEDLFSLV